LKGRGSKVEKLYFRGGFWRPAGKTPKIEQETGGFLSKRERAGPGGGAR